MKFICLGEGHGECVLVLFVIQCPGRYRIVHTRCGSPDDVASVRRGYLHFMVLVRVHLRIFLTEFVNFDTLVFQSIHIVKRKVKIVHHHWLIRRIEKTETQIRHRPSLQIDGGKALPVYTIDAAWVTLVVVVRCDHELDTLRNIVVSDIGVTQVVGAKLVYRN